MKKQLDNDQSIISEQLIAEEESLEKNDLLPGRGTAFRRKQRYKKIKARKDIIVNADIPIKKSKARGNVSFDGVLDKSKPTEKNKKAKVATDISDLKRKERLEYDD